MKIAIPLTAAHEFSAHYGAARALACFQVNTASRSISVESLLLPIGKTPCSWPDWLHYEGVTVMLVGGMGGGARERFTALGIEVVMGVPAGNPADLAAAYLAGSLQPGESTCQHGEHDHDHEPHHDGHRQCAH